MIVSHEHRFIFLKTRKTAGTSVEVFLAPLAGDDAIVTPVADLPSHPARNHTRTIRRYRSLLAGSHVREMRRDVASGQWFVNHSGARIVRARIGPRRWRSYFKFCFERDPWEKTVSKYFYVFAGMANPPPFGEWVLRDELPSDFDRYSLDHRSVAVDFIGRHAHLEDDLAHALRQVGIDAPVALTREKAGLRPEGTSAGELFDAASSERVASVFRREIAAFGYHPPPLVVSRPATPSEDVTGVDTS
jgi:hypothetical protein